MKRYSNLDIHGKLTLRGRFNDQLTTDGGFYSIGFGELAYKTDLGQAAAADTKFYGVSVKLTDNSQRFTGLNVISFNVNDFYIHKRNNNDDEVVVTLDNAVRHVEKSGVLVTNIAANDAPHWKEWTHHTYPPNSVPKGRFARINSYGKFSFSSTATEFYISALLDDEVLYQTGTGAIFSSATDGGMRFEMLLAQVTDELCFFQFNHYSSLSDETATVGDLGAAGTGQISNTHTFRNEGFLVSDPTVARTLRFRLKWEFPAQPVFSDKYYQTVEYL